MKKKLTTSSAIALCRIITEADATWFHTIPPVGEYPGGSIIYNGKPFEDAIIVIDEDGLDAVEASFRTFLAAHTEGMLVDREHFSEVLGKPSDAMAWAFDIRKDTDGLWTRWDFTSVGKQLWDDRVLISRSPVITLERIGNTKKFRATGIRSIAMTNVPFFDTLSTTAAARASGTQNERKTMTKILTLLGLAPEATEDDAATAIQTLIDGAATAKAELTSAKSAQADAEAQCRTHKCDAFIAKHAITGDAVGKFRAAYGKNPEAAEEAYALARESLPKTATAVTILPPTTRITARSATPPADDATLLARYDAMPEGKGKRDFHRMNAVTINKLRKEQKEG
jgi:phage I-like protein